MRVCKQFATFRTKNRLFEIKGESGRYNIALCRMVRLRHGPGVDIDRGEVGAGETARHSVPGEMFVDTMPCRRDAMEALHVC